MAPHEVFYLKIELLAAYVTYLMTIRKTEIRSAPLHFGFFSLAINWLDLHSDAKFVLVVEKEASFQRLMDDNVLQRLHPCIIITVSTSLASSTGCFFDWVS